MKRLLRSYAKVLHRPWRLLATRSSESTTSLIMQSSWQECPTRLMDCTIHSIGFAKNRSLQALGFARLGFQGEEIKTTPTPKDVSLPKKTTPFTKALALLAEDPNRPYERHLCGKRAQGGPWGPQSSPLVVPCLRVGGLFPSSKGRSTIFTPRPSPQAAQECSQNASVPKRTRRKSGSGPAVVGASLSLQHSKAVKKHNTVTLLAR